MSVFSKLILVATAASITAPSVTLGQASKPRVNNENPEKVKGQVKRIHPHALKLILTGKKKEAAEYLKKASASFSDNQEMINEINRIKDILEFSSFFRKSDCMDNLNVLKSSKDELEVLGILKDIK